MIEESTVEPIPPRPLSAERFDVFLSHNSKDKPQVRRLRDALEAQRLNVWYDEDELPPGLEFAEYLEKGIRNSDSVIVVIGENGIGPWASMEMNAALTIAARTRIPLIPVLLAKPTQDLQLPLFLQTRTWVDLSSGINDTTLRKLLWGITGEKSDDSLTESADETTQAAETSASVAVATISLKDSASEESTPRAFIQTVSARQVPDQQYWDRGDFIVTVVVACDRESHHSRIRSIAETVVDPVPLFRWSSNDLLSTGLSEQFRFEFRFVSLSGLLEEVREFTTQSRSSFLIVVSDALPSDGVSVSAETVRDLCGDAPGCHCGIITLIQGRSQRIHNIDRTIDMRVIADSLFLRELSIVADGLRLKAPPARISNAVDPVVIRLVQTREEMLRYLRLRHLIYNRMHYLPDFISHHPAEMELDCYDLFDESSGTGGVHFLALSTVTGDVVGTGRLIVPREFEFSEALSVLGSPPERILQRQSELIRDIVAQHDVEGVLYRAMTRKSFNRMPVLQSSAIEDKALLRGIGLAEISRVIVAPRYRGLGLGRLMIRALVAASINMRKPNVVLECIPAHVPMYRKFGFRVIEGPHGRDESLDQEAVAMILEAPGSHSRTRGIAENDLRIIRTTDSRPQSFADSGYLCLCSSRGCWEEGRYEVRDHQSCPRKTAPDDGH